MTPTLFATVEHGFTWTHEPVIAHGLIALSGRTVKAERAELAVVDVSGAWRFRAPLPQRERPTVMPGPPQISERAIRIAFPSTDRGAVLTFSHRGELVEEWPLPSISPEGIPLALNARVIEAGDGTIVSWCEDENRAWRNSLRDASGKVIGTFPGRVVGETDDVIVLATFDVTGRALAGRRKTDGEELWSLPARGGVISAGGDGVLLVDDESGRERWQAAETLVEIDARTGAKRWSRGFDGELTSAVRARHMTCATEVRGDGSVEVHRIGLDGTVLGTSTWKREGVDPERTSIVALDHTHVLGIYGGRLVCEVLADPGHEAWTLDLPARSGPYATVVDGTIAVVGSDVLHLYGERA